MTASTTSARRRIPASGRGRCRDFEGECIEFFCEMAQIFGVSPSVGQIYGLLYASSQPLAFTDIVERLNVSKGSASQGLQLLRALGAIQEYGGGDGEFETVRRTRYVPELSLRKLVSGVLRERVAPLAGAGAERLARMRQLAERESEPAIKDFCIDRARQLETWRRRLKIVFPMLNALLGPKSQK